MAEVGAVWATQPGLFEREAELDMLAGLARSAAGGAGAAALIEGPAGIGKSELVRAAQVAAVEAGLRPLRVTSSELEQGFSFGVATDLLGRALRSCGPEVRSKLLAGAAGQAAPLLDPDVEPPPQVPGLDPSFTLQHGLYWTCANLSAEAPLMLVVDDAQWADEQSLRWLAFLVRRIAELPALVVVAARSGEAGTSSVLLSSIRNQSEVTVIALHPLGLSSSEQIIRSRVAGWGDAAFYQECHAVTGGNPLLLVELAKALEAKAAGGGAVSIESLQSVGPESIARHAIVRVGGVSAQAVAVAKAVAVLERDANPDLVSRITDVPTQRVAELTDALGNVEVLEKTLPLRFVHPIIRAAIYSEIPSGERAGLHRRAASLLLERGIPVETVAAHLMHAAPAFDRGVVDVLERATELALSRGAMARAKSLIERALLEPPPPERRGHVLLKLAMAKFNLFEPDAVERMQEALPLLSDPSERGLATDALVSLLAVHGRSAEAVQLIRSTLDEVELDREMTLRLTAQLIALARQQPETAGLAEVYLQRLPEGLEGATHGERMALAITAFERAWSGESMVGLEPLMDRAMADGRLYTGDPEVTAPAQKTPLMSVIHTWHFLTMVYSDRLDLAESMGEQAISAVMSQGRAAGVTVVSYWRAILFYRQGRIPEAMAEVETIREIARTASAPALLGAGVLVDCLIDRGKLQEAAQALAYVGLGDEIPPMLLFESLLRARGHLRVAEGQLQEGVNDLLASWDLLEGVGLAVPGYSHARGEAAVILATLGDKPRAREMVQADLKLAESTGVPSRIGVAHRLAGLALGGAEGLEHLQQAVHVLDGAPTALERARALVDVGAALRRGRQRVASREVLRTGWELAQRCGAFGLANRAREELVITGARPRQEIRLGVNALTPSELRVAGMADEGKSNKEIAQALFITMRTVETHLTHVFQKLDISSRRQLPEALQRLE